MGIRLVKKNKYDVCLYGIKSLDIHPVSQQTLTPDRALTSRL